MAQHTNALIHETSPYLLQHAHNPVEWHPWGDEALEKAKRENKMLLVSIGYSSCHWCHVMERESFEDSVVAAVMNEHFVCIKVDREERPDVDHLYMEAVQLLTRSGGWPLNCFALPDGRPFYGGTYFKRNEWISICERVAKEYREKPEEVIEFAQKLTEGVVSSNEITRNEKDPFFHAEVLELGIQEWKKDFDTKYGGEDRAPKFPLPTNQQFLLRYAKLHNDFEVRAHVLNTLDKMALGGIYDQIGGGFARYSTDVKWLVPHFEKMLYDNAQLLSVYAEAYQETKKPLYRETILETVEFCNRELSNGEGIFYSALDADSEGEEGKFYVWTETELEQVLGDDFEFAIKYFNINNDGYWEHNHYILTRSESDESFAQSHNLNFAEVKTTKKRVYKKLMAERDLRVRPGLDDKSLTSWNALMLKGLCDAYLATHHQPLLETALQTAKFITETQRQEDRSLYHSYKKGKSSIQGFLEDYAFAIEGLISLYTVTQDEHWLQEAHELTKTAISKFYQESNGMFRFGEAEKDTLLSSKVEVNDNVIPASNSTMARNLFYLSHLLENDLYAEKAEAMLNNVQNGIARYPQGYSNWGVLMMHYVHPFYEVAIAGEEAHAKVLEMGTSYQPNSILVGAEKVSTIPLFESRFVDGTTLIYVCRNKACQLPTESVSEAIKQMH